ncbi:MAG: phosphotransferase [Frankiales bacterium]|nr:phosphotransferase [Frankiales bacterium]
MSEQAPDRWVDHDLAAPFRRFDADAVAGLLAQGWGLVARDLVRLDTERDDTFLATLGSDTVVVKVAHPADDAALVDLQVRALQHAADRDPALPLPRLRPDTAGAPVRRVAGAQGEPRLARVLDYLPGSTLEYALTDAAQRRAVGRAAGRLSAALADFDHPAAGRVLPWDLQQVASLRPLLAAIGDPAVATDVAAVLDRYDAEVGPRLRAARQQVVHNDLNPDNVLVDPAGPEFVTGILDFGDVVRTAVVADLAVAMAYAVGADHAFERHHVDPWAAPYDVAEGFVSVRELDDDEAALLPDLVVTRLAQRLLVNSWLAASDPANAGYTARSVEHAARALRRLASAPAPASGVG